MALETLQNIKIPYPSEGIIRTAALDDTVAPVDSVQIAVNMNFDRIGAFQTRLGLTEYADDLTGEIMNFGTLNNTIIPDGFTRLDEFPDSAVFESGAFADDVEAFAIDDTTYLVLWAGEDGDGFGAVYTADLDTGAFTLLGGPTEWSATDAENITITRIDTTHFLIVFQGTGDDGFAQVMTVSGGTITMEGSPLEFNTDSLVSNSVAMIDANHFLVCYESTDGDGFAEVLEVNLGTWAVTEVGTPLEFDTGDAEDISCVAVGDGTHFIVFWDSLSADGLAQCLTVNTGTWAVTAEGTPLVFANATSDGYNSCQSLGDGEHFINFWRSTTGGMVQVFELDTGTFAVTALGSPLNFTDTDGAIYNSSAPVGDGQHFLNAWRASDTPNDAILVQAFEVNLSTFAVTESSNALEFSETQSVGSGSRSLSLVIGDDYRPVIAWILPDATGEITMFEMTGTPETFTWLYAQEEDGDVLNWDNPGWTVRRTGVNPEHKARFTQYLNRIWMVNGNELEGGDPVMTSDGGNFDTTLVPEGFPPGDFIQAGFEGRVWVVDKLAGVVYFTNIVQFTPPNTYTLTYTAESNFIKNFSPQNGQSPTGLFTTPRALLLFQQDNIYRIYGALSVDNYPAYNVGTYSQESIVQTKDGIYFHHSSGFYKFSYDGQPIEISRRIIDFIQAIPRANYENVIGIFDGFDSVEWAVGAVTVEGVTFTNCVCRYTISTQIWTIYDYPGNYITAMIQYDDREVLNMIMGTDEGKVNKMDDGFTDLGDGIYYEIIDRWRTYSDVYAKTQAIDGMNIYNENAGGAKIQYQAQKAFPNVWQDLGTIDENASALLPNASSEDFNAARLRINGVTKGNPVVFHGIELLEVQVKGYDKN